MNRPPARRLQALEPDIPVLLQLSALCGFIASLLLWLITGRREPELMGMCLTVIATMSAKQGLDAIAASRSSQQPGEPGAAPLEQPAIPPPDPDPAA